MKIYVFGKIYPDSFAKNIVVTLKAMGHEIRYCRDIYFDSGTSMRFSMLLRYARRIFPYVEERSYKTFVREVKDFRPDLVVIPGEQPPPAVINEIRSGFHGNVVQWFPDALSGFSRDYILASDYDAIFVKDHYVADTWRRKLGKPVYVLQQACNPMWHHRVNLTMEDWQRYGCDLTVAGNLYYWRVRQLEICRDYNMKIWGTYIPHWLESPVLRFHQRHYVAEEEKARAYNAAKIVLNMLHYAEIDGYNLRTYEAAGCGAFQIVDWKPCLPLYFEPEVEIVTFKSLDELKEKVDYYLAHDDERQAIADRAYVRAHREHTYERRLQRLLEITFDGKSDIPA